jgi:hypothetical protein
MNTTTDTQATLDSLTSVYVSMSKRANARNIKMADRNTAKADMQTSVLAYAMIAGCNLLVAYETLESAARR